MKMKKEHYEQIKVDMEKVITGDPRLKEGYKEYGRSKERYAWGVFWATRPRIVELYEYLNDSHITTALLRIIGEY